jgi:hypothetical protein
MVEELLNRAKPCAVLPRLSVSELLCISPTMTSFVVVEYSKGSSHVLRPLHVDEFDGHKWEVVWLFRISQMRNREKEASREDILLHEAVTTLPAQVLYAISGDATYCRANEEMWKSYK